IVARGVARMLAVPPADDRPETGEPRDEDSREEDRRDGASPGARGPRRLEDAARGSVDDVRPWEHLGSEEHPHMLLFRPRWDRLRNPRTGEALRRLVLETPDWVNVVALTPEEELVVVRQ